MSELGKVLKAARESNGLSLDDLQGLTKIQKRYLVGIEKGNYEMMPGKFYVRAFIKQYAEAVGLDPEELFEQYKSDIPSAREDEIPEQLSRVNAKKTMSPVQAKALEVLPKVLVAVFIIGVLIALWALFAKLSASDKPSENTGGGNVIGQIDDTTGKKPESADDGSGQEERDLAKEDEEKPKKEEKPSSELTAVESSGSETVYELKGADSFTLKIQSKGETWVQLKGTSGSVLFSGMLSEGMSEEQDLSEEESVELRIGKAPDTELYVNGELLEYEIPASERVTQNITIRYAKDE